MDISVTIHNGQVSVTAPPGVLVEVRDYNVPDDWEGDIQVDSDGDRYERMTFNGGERVCGDTDGASTCKLPKGHTGSHSSGPVAWLDVDLTRRP